MKIQTNTIEENKNSISDDEKQQINAVMERARQKQKEKEGITSSSLFNTHLIVRGEK